MNRSRTSSGIHILRSNDALSSVACADGRHTPEASSPGDRAGTRLLALLAVLLLGFACAMPAHADIDSGVQWLISRDGASGVHRATDLANANDSNAESWITISLLSRTAEFPQLDAVVRDQSAGTLTSLARLAKTRLDQGQSATAQLSVLLAAQLADGGFPAKAGFQSEPLTTAWTLLALERAGQGEGTPAARAIGYLISSQQSNGGHLSATGNLPSVFASSHVAQAFALYRNRFDLTLPINRTKAFLESMRKPDQSFGEAFETGLALDALLALRADRAALAPVATALAAQQLSNGSFSDDAYVSALALRALWRYEQPDVSPTLSGITGRVISADTELAIAGAQFALTGASTATLVTNSTGMLQSSTLQGGNYTAVLSFAGMRSIEFQITLVNGRTLDLGTLRMIQGSSPTGDYAVIHGLVTDSETNLPIPGALMALANPPTQVVSDADGRYQFLQVPVGPVEISATATGYSSRSVQLTATPRTVIEFSMSLSPNPTGAGARIRGVIVDANTGQPLPGVSIAATAGVPPVATQTDAMGAYELTVAASAMATITATLVDYDPVTIQVPLVDNQVLIFSPRLYPSGTTPNGANRARITGRIVNQANRQPIERALVVAVDASGQQTIQTDTQGLFVITSLAGPTVQLSITADAFVPATVLVPLLPLEQRNIGSVGLKPTTIDYYFPDLVIVDSTLSTTEPDTFALTDHFTVEVANRGTSATTQDFTLVAFVDANANGVFDVGVEPEIGRVRVDRDMPIGNSVSVDIAVTALLAFRDAPVAFWVDAENEIPEQIENNNVATSLLGCRIEQTPINPGTIYEAWHWNGLASNQLVNSINQVPSVTQLTDDNGDGVINQYDIPDLVFVAGQRATEAPNVTALVAISGDDGHELWSRTNILLSPFSSVATGDIDNDGVAEIIVVRNYRQELIAFENDGTLKWRTPLNGPGVPIPVIPPTGYVYDQPIIVNLEGDNEAEIVLGREAFRGLTGEQLWEGEFDAGGDGGVPETRPLMIASNIASIAADVNLDGRMEVIAGRTLYDFEGRTIWHRGDIEPGFNLDKFGTVYTDPMYAAVGNFDLDDQAEIVLIIGDRMYLLEHTGQTIWGPKYSPDNQQMGAPVVIDIDADGLPEILVSSRGPGPGDENKGRLTIFESDGTVKRTVAIRDGSGVTSPAVFDFQNDGRYEILHVDEQDFRVLDALSGQELFKTRHTSRTVFEYPVVADIDGDKQAEIILTGFDDDLIAGVTPGIRVFKARNGAFADAGSVWGSHAFHIDDVAENSIIPLLETPSWLTHNTYRTQRSPLPDPLGMPDFSVGDLRLIDQGPGLDPVVQVRVGNAGPVDAHEPPFISIFRGDPASGGLLLKQLRLDTLRPARFQIVNLGTIPLTGSGELYAVADVSNKARECREINNQRSIAFTATNGLGDLQLGTDKLSYVPGETAELRATVSNTGALPAGFRVRWSIRNSQGQTTTTLDDLDIASVAAGESLLRTLNWPSNGVLAGSYVLAGALLNAQGVQIDTATASFAIAGDVSGPAGGLALGFDRATYTPGEVVTLSFRATNLSSSEVIRLPEVVITVTGPGGYTLQRSFPYGDLFVAGFVEGTLGIDGSGAAGSYTATGRLRSRLTNFEYATDSSSFERFADTSALIQGFVDVAIPMLTLGQQQNCLYTARNRGTAPQLGMNLRRGVVNLDTGAVLSQQAFIADLVPGADFVANDTVPTMGFSAGDHACVLEVSDGSNWRVLDSEPFVLEGLPPPDILVTPVTGLVTSEAGQSAQFTVSLTAAPIADVTIPMSVSDATEFALASPSLTFTPANWDIPRLVGVAGIDDTLVDGDIAGSILIAAAESTDPAYSGIDPPDVGVTNLDDDAVAVHVSPLLVETSENGTSASFTVSINAAPTDAVTIPVTSSDATEWSVDRSTLTFSSANWQTPQAVLVTGLDDVELDGLQMGTIELLPVQSADSRFNGIDPPDVVARNTDNDGAGITVDPLSVVTAENGAAGSFTVRLNAPPSAEVLVPIGPVDSTEWQILDLDVRLDASNWQTGRTVLVTPIDDAQVDGDQTAVLVLGPAQSADVRFNGLDPADVSLTNLDDDGPQILVNPTSGLIVNEGGSSDSFTVSLTEAPTDPVTVAISSGDPSEFSLAVTEIQFTPQDYAPRTVIVAGVDDTEVDGNIVGSIVLDPAVSADSRYAGIDPPNVLVTNLDDEVVQVLVTPMGSIETSEAGTSAFVEVRVSTVPTADLVIALRNPDTTEWAFDATELRFTPADWATPKRLTVTGVNDLDIDGDIVGVIGLAPIASADPRYQGLDPIDIPAVNRDNDVPAAILVSPEGPIQTTEAGGSASFQVSLSTEPSAEVRIALSNPDSTEFSLDRTEIVFALASWETPQTVTVTGVDDPDLDGDISAAIGLAPAVSADNRYQGIDPRDMPVINLNDDFVAPAELQINALDLVVSEAGEGGRIEISLNRPPVSTTPVRLLVTSANPGEVLALPHELLFDQNNATLPQAIILSGVDEFIDDGDQTVLVQIAVSADSDPDFAALPPTSLSVLNIDNDTAGLTLNLTGPQRILESESTTLALTLTSQPTAEVSVILQATLRPPGQTGDLLFELVPLSATIQPSQWNNPLSLRLLTTDNGLDNLDQIVDVRLTQVQSADPNYAGQSAPDVAIDVIDRGPYGLQEIPINRWMPLLALLTLIFGLLAVPRIQGRSA